MLSSLFSVIKSLFLSLFTLIKVIFGAIEAFVNVMGHMDEILQSALNQWLNYQNMLASLTSTWSEYSLVTVFLSFIPALMGVAFIYKLLGRE